MWMVPELIARYDSWNFVDPLAGARTALLSAILQL